MSRMTPKMIMLLVAVLLLITILVQNSDATILELFFWDVPVPLFILILTTMILGWIAGWFTHMAYRRGKDLGRASKMTTGGSAPQTGPEKHL